MDDAGWWKAHVRPRDLFIWGTVGMLLVLAGVVWVTRLATDRVETIFSLMLGAVTTLGGYYQGNRDADRAGEREASARAAASLLRSELGLAREKVAFADAQFRSESLDEDIE